MFGRGHARWIRPVANEIKKHRLAVQRSSFYVKRAAGAWPSAVPCRADIRGSQAVPCRRGGAKVRRI